MNNIERIIRIKGLEEAKEQVIIRLDLLGELQMDVKNNDCIKLSLIQKILKEYKEYTYILSGINLFNENLNNGILELKVLAEEIEHEISKLKHSHFIPSHVHITGKMTINNMN